MIWASAIWIAGFACRAVSIHNVQNVNLYIAQNVLILVGPSIFSAAETFILSRLLAYLPYHAPIHPGRVVSTFLQLSICVETLTATGAVISADAGQNKSQRQQGLDLLKAALILQCCVEAFFFSLVVLFEYRCRRAKRFPQRVRTVCYILYITSFMILVRCVVRTVEGFEQSSCETADLACGTIFRNEWFLWTFEVANITLFVILLLVFHPGRYLPSKSAVYLDLDGTTERLGPGFSQANKRPIRTRILDPFDIVGTITGKGMAVDKFWGRDYPTYSEKY